VVVVDKTFHSNHVLHWRHHFLQWKDLGMSWLKDKILVNIALLWHLVSNKWHIAIVTSVDLSVGPGFATLGTSRATEKSEGLWIIGKIMKNWTWWLKTNKSYSVYEMGFPLRNPSLFTIKFDSLLQFYFLKQLKILA